MGGEAKTSTSDEFKSLEMEMNLRHDGAFPLLLLLLLLPADERVARQAWISSTLR